MDLADAERETPASVTWTDRGFVWVQNPSRAPVLWSAGLAVVTGLLSPLLFTVCYVLRVPVFLTFIPLLGVGVLWLRALSHAAHIPPAWRLEVEGPTVRIRATHFLVELGLEHLDVERKGPRTVALADGRNEVEIHASDDTDWLVDALTRAQQAWQAHRGGGVPDAERAALARLRA